MTVREHISAHPKGYTVGAIAATILATASYLGIENAITPVTRMHHEAHVETHNKHVEDFEEFKAATEEKEVGLTLELRALRLSQDAERLRRDKRRSPDAWDEDDQRKLERTEQRLEDVEDLLWDSITP